MPSRCVIDLLIWFRLDGASLLQPCNVNTWNPEDDLEHSQQRYDDGEVNRDTHEAVLWGCRFEYHPFT
jgi:hypothetical protein